MFAVKTNKPRRVLTEEYLQFDRNTNRFPLIDKKLNVVLDPTECEIS